MLLAAGMAPVLIAALVGFGFEPLTEAAGSVVDLEAHRPLIVGAALLLTPLLIGFVVGFLLVEEREERILEAVAVTGRGSDGFLAYRVGMPAVVGGLSALGVAVAVGSLTPQALIVVSALAGMTAGTVCLTLAVVARDRVQALAISKLTGFALVAAVAFQFVEGWWRLPFVIVPTTWVLEAAVATEPWAAFALGIITHTFVGALLWTRARRLMLG
jgi:hypothetical protein